MARPPLSSFLGTTTPVAKDTSSATSTRPPLSSFVKSVPVQAPVEEKSMSIIGGAGPVDFAKDVLTAGKNAIGTVATEFGGGEQGIAQKLKRDIAQGAKEYAGPAGVDQLTSLAKTGFRVAGDIAGAVYTPVGAVVGGVMEATGVQKGIDWLGQKIAEKSGITDIPAVQKWAMEHPQAAEDFGRAMNLIAAAGDKGQIRPKEMVTEAKAVPAKVTTYVKEKLPSAQSSFEKKVNQALPVLKKDVKNLPQKYDNAKKAFSDIVDNKEKIGIVDENGNPRLPKNFQETTVAQDTRMKDVYKEYSAKLTGIDKQKFDVNIHDQIFKQIDDLKAKLAKENSITGRKTLSRQMSELSSLRDISPEGIQNYIERLNQQSRGQPGAPLTIEQIESANLAGKMRGVLDSSVEKIDGVGYQDLRNTYGSHRALQDQLLMAAKKEINAVPGLTDKLVNLGLTAEGLNFILTHDPVSILTAVGVKGTASFVKWFNSPQRALRGIYRGLEKGTYRDLTPSKINQSANVPAASSNSASVIESTLPQQSFIDNGIEKGIQAVKDYIKDPKLGASIKDISKIHPEDLAELRDFTDYVAGTYKPSTTQIVTDARRIAVKYGLISEKLAKNISDKGLSSKITKSGIFKKK